MDRKEMWQRYLVSPWAVPFTIGTAVVALVELVGNPGLQVMLEDGRHFVVTVEERP